LKGISRNVVFLGIVSFFTDVSSEMIFPILPIFLEKFVGASKFQIGIIEGLAQLTASTLKIFSGFVSDRLRRRKLLVTIGYSLSNFLKPALYFAGSWLQVLFIRVLDRVGKGIRTAPRDALISESTEERVSGKSFGLHRALDTLGAVVGTLLAFLVLLLLGSNESAFRTVFAISAIPGLISIIILILFVKEKSGVVKEKIKFKLSGIPKVYFKFVSVQSLFTLFSMNYAFMILKSEHSGISVGFIPLAYLLYNLVYSIFCFPFGMLSDRFGKTRVLSLVYILFSISAFLFTLRSGFVAWVAFSLYGTFMAGFETVSRAVISDFSGEEFKGTAFGIYHTLIGISSFISLSIAGFLWDKFGASFPFYVSSFVSLISSFILLKLVK